MVSMLGADELKRRARLSWEHARTTHTRENFAAVFRGAIVASLEWLEKRNSTFRRPHLRPVSIWRETVTPSEAVG
jgi:hypothetical protein